MHEYAKNNRAGNTSAKICNKKIIDGTLVRFLSTVFCVLLLSQDAGLCKYNPHSRPNPL